MIELTKPMYGTRCNHCFSNDNVKEISIHSDGMGIIIRLCAKCRGELIRTLLNDNKMAVSSNDLSDLKLMTVAHNEK